MGIMNGLTFGGVNSLDYGIFISGEAVYNAPVRDVEAIAVPGRNGDIILDKGRFQNIEVEYPAGTFGDDSDDFSAKLSEFRNAILSQVGYQRLEDTYHSDEYRMGVYADGLEVDPVQYNSAGEFKLKFNCKPQRWLKSGEDAETVTSGGTITNPTLFESSPLLEVEGYGNIQFNGFDIDIENVVFGNVQISEDTSTSAEVNLAMCNVGDVMYSPHYNNNDQNYYADGSYKITPKPGYKVSGWGGGNVQVISSGVTHNVGTLWTESRAVVTSNFYVTELSTGTTTTCTAHLTWYVRYDGDHTISTWVNIYTTPASAIDTVDFNIQNKLYGIWCDSTETILGHPTYIDCEIGECYKIENGIIAPLNAYIDLGSDLPELAAGINTFNFDNTVTDLKVVPRWWRV